MKVLLALACIVLTNQAVAHHNMTALYDFNDRVSLQGTLTKVDWRNPHTYLTVEVKGSDGAVETWLVEGPPPSFYRIRDFGKADFDDTIGKTVKVELSRSRDKSRSGLIRTLVFPNGKVVSACPQNC
ncbi:MAG TPA: DUF6152 family protein [Bryobacteraceae bacterium]|nr:DUF6152 family protein [Bryobacteraceae bacterium]